ncbi:MAG: ABC transporter substrate-binding protein [Alphaproteobacteria bacterium]|nr:ABC transporter substrate-binding protein [Alphaproteobacteria bacterium]
MKQRSRLRSMLLASALVTATGIGFSFPVEAEPKGTLTIAQSLLRQQFDPTLMVATTDFTTYDILFDGLLNLGPKGKEAALAESWTVSADGKQIDFKLRRGVKFHNGDPLTAEDVKFTYEKLLEKDNTHSYRAAFVELLERVDVVAPDHARFILKGPWPAFFTSARYPLTGIVPKAYYEKVGPKGFQQNPVGTGPFKLAETKAGEWNKFEANADYWGGAPKIKTVVAQLVKEPFTRYAMLERGEADIIVGLTGPLLERVRTNPKVKIYSSNYSGTSGLYFSRKEFPESADKRVRLAIAHAINREEIAKNVLGGVCEVASSIFTPATFGHLPGLEPIKYDPAKAKALLSEAGLKPGHKVTFSLHTESFGSLPNAPQVLEAIAGNLEAIGLTLERKPLDTGAWLAMMRGGKQPGIYYGPSSLPDDGGETINGWFASWSVWSAGNVNVPEYDNIFRQQLQISDLKEREKLLHQFAKMEHEKLEGIPLFWCHTPFAVSTRVTKWNPGVSSGYHLNLDDMELAN